MYWYWVCNRDVLPLRHIPLSGDCVGCNPARKKDHDFLHASSVKTVQPKTWLHHASSWLHDAAELPENMAAYCSQAAAVCSQFGCTLQPTGCAMQPSRHTKKGVGCTFAAKDNFFLAAYLAAPPPPHIKEYAFPTANQRAKPPTAAALKPLPPRVEPLGAWRATALLPQMSS